MPPPSSDCNRDRRVIQSGAMKPSRFAFAESKSFLPDSFPARWAALWLRWGLGTAFLSACADRLGLWGPPGSRYASWGDWAHFVDYTGKLNWFLPHGWIPAIAVIATTAEIVLGAALLIGIYTRYVAFASSALLTLFALSMTVALGVKSPLNFSVFTAAAAAALLGAVSRRIDV